MLGAGWATEAASREQEEAPGPRQGRASRLPLCAHSTDPILERRGPLSSPRSWGPLLSRATIPVSAMLSVLRGTKFSSEREKLWAVRSQPHNSTGLSLPTWGCSPSPAQGLSGSGARGTW